jgi:excinuclease ABC subunit C
MRRESKDLHFERAAALRDAIAAVRDSSRTTKSTTRRGGQGLLAWAEEGPMVTFAVFQMRSGRWLEGTCSARAGPVPRRKDCRNSSWALRPARKPPPKIILSSAADLSLVTDWMDRELGIRPAIVPPEGKRHQAALAMALQNAREDIGRRLREGGDPEAVAALGKALGLARAPERIEGFDIAHLEGNSRGLHSSSSPTACRRRRSTAISACGAWGAGGRLRLHARSLEQALHPPPQRGRRAP